MNGLIWGRVKLDLDFPFHFDIVFRGMGWEEIRWEVTSSTLNLRISVSTSGLRS